MNSVDRVKAVFHGETPDRVPIVDYYWASTVANWRNDGLGDDAPEFIFDHDIVYFFFDPRFGFEEKLLAEDEEYLTIFSTDGETVRVPKDPNSAILQSDALGLIDDYSIKTRGDWEKHKHLYQADEWRMHSNPPLSGSWFGVPDMASLQARYQRAIESNKFTCLVFREPYECIREITGTETMLLSMATDPDWVREMLEQNLALTLDMLAMFDRHGLHMDGYWVWGDIAFNKGMFFSPAMYRTLLAPVHEALFEHLGDYFIYHTDGNLSECLPLLVEAGIRGINPIEIKAGNDFDRIVEIYGDRLVLTGGVDVRAFSSNDKMKIEDEIRGKLSVVRGSRYIYHSDHSIPCDVQLESYRFALDMVRKYGRY